MAKIDEARRAFQKIIGAKQDRIERKRGILGDGNGNVRVSSRPDMVYMRLNASSANVWQVFNDTVADMNDLPVIVEKMPGSTVWRVVEIDRGVLTQIGSGFGANLKNPTHHEQHEWQEGLQGADAVTVFPRNLEALRTELNSTTTYSLQVDVRPIRYTYEGVVKEFKGATLSLASYIPVSGTRLVLTYLDVRDNTVYGVPGAPTTYSATADPVPPRVPWYAKPSALITIRQNQNIITEGDIEDMRLVVDHQGTVHNLEAATAPGVTNDATSGFSRGSLWIDRTSNEVYVLTNPAIGAAVWKNMATTDLDDGKVSKIYESDGGGPAVTVGATGDQTNTGDLFLKSDDYGLFDRLVNYGRTPDEHWQGGAEVLSWTGWAAYTGFVTPGSLTVANSLYKVAYNGSFNKAFRYRAAATGAAITLYARCAGLNFARSGLMIDDGSGNADGEGANNFYRVYLMSQFPFYGDLNVVEEYRTGGGALTTNTLHTVFPGEFAALVIKAGVTGTRWSNWDIQGGILAEGGLTNIGAAVTGQTWTPARVGIFFANDGGSVNDVGLWDWYEEATS